MTEYRVDTALVVTGPSRAILDLEGKPPLAVAPPERFGGPPGHWTPEDLLVCAAESCLMLTFGDLARRRGLPVLNYRSRAVGIVVKDAHGLRMTRIEIYPELDVAGSQESVEQARALLEVAHSRCLVARSLETEVVIFPFVSAAAPAA